MPNSSYTILYVDDDQDDLVLIAEAFEKYTSDLRVTHAHDGHECMQILRRMHEKNTSPCLIILDLNMPLMDGKQTLAEIKSADEYKEIPVVLFSTSSQDGDRLYAEKHGVDFVIKPARFSDIEKLVEQFVEKCRFQVKSPA